MGSHAKRETINNADVNCVPLAWKSAMHIPHNADNNIEKLFKPCGKKEERDRMHRITTL